MFDFKSKFAETKAHAKVKNITLILLRHSSYQMLHKYNSQNQFFKKSLPIILGYWYGIAKTWCDTSQSARELPQILHARQLPAQRRYSIQNTLIIRI